MKRISQPSLVASQVTGIVLCGGRGLRMGGADKPLARYQGKPMVQLVLERLSTQVDTCLVSANRNLKLYQRLADSALPKQAPIAVITDQLADYQGPLAGIHSALQQCKTPWFLVCPGDAPCPPTNLLASLAAQRSQVHAVVAYDGERQQHLHFLGHRNLLGPLRRYLDSGRRSVAGFHEANGAVSVRFGEPQDFASINQID